MKRSLDALVDRFARLSVVVIGEAMLDSYLEGTVGRLCHEAPVPVVNVRERRNVPGGAANTAANVRRLGGEVVFLSVIGDDLEGSLLRDSLAASGVSPEHLLVRPGRATLAKHRVVADSQMLLRFDQGTTDAIDRETEERLIDSLAAFFPTCDAVLVSDYGYGILTRRVIDALRDLQAHAPRVVVVDARNLRAYRHVGVTAVKPNYDEALRLLRTTEVADGDRGDRIAAHAQRILDITRAEIAAVTLDTEGALVVERGRPAYRTYASPAAHSRASGAGDTFASALALALAAGADMPSAAELASAAATVVVGKEGTTTCSAGELRHSISAGEKHVSDLARLLALTESDRERGRRIVFTNGCFDILHRVHITYLNRAKELGDVLVVGVNSDEGVRRLKGSERPINPLEDRVEVLAALSCVDRIIAFEEDTPSAIIEAIRPDVFVKGGDYTRETLPEAELVESLGGEVQILPFIEDRSTTGVIARIRALAEHERSLASG